MIHHRDVTTGHARCRSRTPGDITTSNIFTVECRECLTMVVAQHPTKRLRKQAEKRLKTLPSFPEEMPIHHMAPGRTATVDCGALAIPGGNATRWTDDWSEVTCTACQDKRYAMVTPTFPILRAPVHYAEPPHHYPAACGAVPSGDPRIDYRYTADPDDVTCEPCYVAYSTTPQPADDPVSLTHYLVSTDPILTACGTDEGLKTVLEEDVTCSVCNPSYVPVAAMASSGPLASGGPISGFPISSSTPPPPTVTGGDGITVTEAGGVVIVGLDPTDRRKLDEHDTIVYGHDTMLGEHQRALDHLSKRLDELEPPELPVAVPRPERPYDATEAGILAVLEEFGHDPELAAEIIHQTYAEHHAPAAPAAGTSSVEGDRHSFDGIDLEQLAGALWDASVRSTTANSHDSALAATADTKNVVPIDRMTSSTQYRFADMAERIATILTDPARTPLRHQDDP